ncbi:MAG: pyrroline-5-carboxylate reductase [Cyanobacteria bacterium P01_H01_bin.74]
MTKSSHSLKHTTQSECTIETMGVIGVGTMGKAIIQGVQQAKTLSVETIWGATHCETTSLQVSEKLNILCSPQYFDWVPTSSLIVLAVKPYQINSVLETLKNSGLDPETLVISIAAGVSLKQMETALNTENPLSRVMTNTPSLVHQGMAAYCGNAFFTSHHQNWVQCIFSEMGQCIALPEKQFDVVTALSGSGPAFVFMMIESLADGAVKMGLPRQTALQVATQVVSGSATMVQQSHKHPAQLKDEVTTPGGCTIAGLHALEHGKFRAVVAQAIEAATHTANVLGSQS